MRGKYEVGYKKPPKSGQFKKGKSGNPRGRKKGARGFITMVKGVLTERVPVTQGGVQNSITVLEAVLKTCAARAVKGDAKAAALLLKIAQQVLPANDEPDEAPPESRSEEREKALLFFEQLAADVENGVVVEVEGVRLRPSLFRERQDPQDVTVPPTDIR